MFGIDKEQLKELGAIDTASEIVQQPEMWQATLDILMKNKDHLADFIGEITEKEDYNIVLTGAGTSEFIGNALCSALSETTNHKIHSYATTEIVVDPRQYLSRDKPTLLVSFGRSGNSPESLGAIEIANQICKNIKHVFITCNKDGEISKRAKELGNSYLLLLPEKTNDRGFAMTSSFTSMYVAALVMFNLSKIDQYKSMIKEMGQYVTELLAKNWMFIKDVVNAYDFNRIVYLGSGVLKGIAQESALKMLELNAGKIATFFDSPLGFRHGPKSIIDDKTLTVIYMSDNEYSRQYDMDLIRELSVQRNGNKLMVVCDGMDREVGKLVDYNCVLHCGQAVFPAEIISLGCVVVAQTLALLKSLDSGITPDTPCKSGAVSRVVKGVTIYPYKEKKNER